MGKKEIWRDIMKKKENLQRYTGNKKKMCKDITGKKVYGDVSFKKKEIWKNAERCHEKKEKMEKYHDNLALTHVNDVFTK